MDVIVPKTKSSANYQITGVGGVFDGKQGGYRAAINVAGEWVHLGYYDDLQMAAYRFNIAAIFNGMPERVFADAAPSEEALEKWRTSNPYNLVREQNAHEQYAEYLAGEQDEAA